MLRARLLYGRLALRSDKVKGQQSRTVSRGSRSTNQRRSSHIRSWYTVTVGAAAVALVIIISLSSSAPAQLQSPLPPQYRFRKRYPARRRSAELYVKHSTRNFGLRAQTGSSSANQSERPETRPPYTGDERTCQLQIRYVTRGRTGNGNAGTHARDSTVLPVASASCSSVGVELAKTKTVPQTSGRHSRGWESLGVEREREREREKERVR